MVISNDVFGNVNPSKTLTVLQSVSFIKEWEFEEKKPSRTKIMALKEMKGEAKKRVFLTCFLDWSRFLFIE